MFASTNMRLQVFTYEFCIAVSRSDVPHMKQMMARIVLLLGEIVLLQFVVRLLERTVSVFFLAWGTWLTVGI